MKKVSKDIQNIIKKHPNAKVTWRIEWFWGRKTLIVYVNGLKHILLSFTE